MDINDQRTYPAVAFLLLAAAIAHAGSDRRAATVDVTQLLKSEVIELAAQGDRRGPVRFERRGGAAARLLRQRLIDRQRQGKCRMGGEHRGEAGAFRPFAVFRPANRAVVWVRAQQVMCEAGQDPVVHRGVDAAQIGADARGTVVERGIAQVAYQDRNIGFRLGWRYQAGG